MQIHSYMLCYANENVHWEVSMPEEITVESLTVNEKRTLNGFSVARITLIHEMVHKFYDDHFMAKDIQEICYDCGFNMSKEAIASMVRLGYFERVDRGIYKMTQKSHWTSQYFMELCTDVINGTVSQRSMR